MLSWTWLRAPVHHPQRPLVLALAAAHDRNAVAVGQRAGVVPVFRPLGGLGLDLFPREREALRRLPAGTVDKRPGELRLPEHLVGMLEGLLVGAVPGDAGELAVRRVTAAVADERVGPVNKHGVHAEVEDIAVAA